MIANSPEQCSETVQCMNRNACYRSSQNPWRRGSDKSGIQCLGRKAGYAWMDLGPGLDPRVEEPGTACRPALLPPVAAARRPAAGGKGPGNLRASRAETAAALFLSPVAFFFFFFLPGPRHPRPTPYSHLSGAAFVRGSESVNPRAFCTPPPPPPPPPRSRPRFLKKKGVKFGPDRE